MVLFVLVAFGIWWTGCCLGASGCLGLGELWPYWWWWWCLLGVDAVFGVDLILVCWRTMLVGLFSCSLDFQINLFVDLLMVCLCFRWLIVLLLLW